MPLIECEDCGAKVSPRAQSCPRCGAPVPRPGDKLDAGIGCLYLFEGLFRGCGGCALMIATLAGLAAIVACALLYVR